MTPEQFTHWLSGYLQEKDTLTETQCKTIQDMIAETLTKVTPTRTPLFTGQHTLMPINVTTEFC